MKNCNCCTTYNAPDLMDGGVTAARIEQEADGWTDGGTVGNAAYWRARAEHAEALCSTETAVASHRGATIERLAKERDDARIMAALWKETARRAIRGERAMIKQGISIREQMSRERGELFRVAAERNDAVTRAGKAEQERDVLAERVRDFADSIRREQETNDRLRAEQPRPLTPDAITDEMRGRARKAAAAQMPDSWWGGTEWWRYADEILTAALTEPTRPEGAERWETWLSRLDYLHDETGASRADLATLANDLATETGLTSTNPEPMEAP